MLQDTPGGNMHATVSAHILLAPQGHRVRGWLKIRKRGLNPVGVATVLLIVGYPLGGGVYPRIESITVS